MKICIDGFHFVLPLASLAFFTPLLNDASARAAEQTVGRPTRSWALDRVDQDFLPLSGSYGDGMESGIIEHGGKGVSVYLIDGGVFRDHHDFGGRVELGVDLSGAPAIEDCTPMVPSHGTHTAGIVASKSYGVAPGATVVDVRILDCSGKTTREKMIEALHWVQQNAKRPALVSMSVGSSNPADEIDDAVTSLINSGLALVVSAGNEDIDACEHFPSNVPEVIVVGASSDHDVMAPFSNYGKCVDVVAPGWMVLSTMAKHQDASGEFFGTSQAAPFVSGALALYLAKHPEATPFDMKRAIQNSATMDVLKGELKGTPNRLLNVRRLLE